MEPWKYTAQLIGRTKLSRGRGSTSRNDGRAPDTAAALVGSKSVQKKKVKQKKESRNTDPAVFGYSWDNSSCWLDTSLQLLYISVRWLWASFNQRMRPLGEDTHLGRLYHHFRQRALVEKGSVDEDAIIKDLTKHRDALLKVVKQSGLLVESSNGYQSLYVRCRLSYAFLAGRR